MLTVIRRLSALFLTLALATSQAGVCAGWMATPEARMACCSDDGPCPMHESNSEDDGSKRAVSQAEADRCCAISEQDDSAPAPANLAFPVTLVPVNSPVPVMRPMSEAHAGIWRAPVPLSGAHTPKHILLSVFLV